MSMPGTDADVIDTLVGIAPGSPLDAIRARRPEARTHAQASYRALFAPADAGTVTAPERFAVGSFVAGLHGQTAIADFYGARLADSGACDLFAPVHVTARKYPEPVTWLDSSPDQHDPVVLRTNDGPDRYLRVEVQHLSAPAAHEAFRVA